MKELLRWNKINLCILSKVKPNGRVSTKGTMLVIEKDSYFQGVWRFLNGESRKEAVESIKSIVQVAIELSQCIMNQKTFVDFVESKTLDVLDFKLKCHQLTEIAEDLKNGIVGIENLIIGYKNDEGIVAQFEVMIRSIHEEVSTIQKTIAVACEKYDHDHPDTPIYVPLEA